MTIFTTGVPQYTPVPATFKGNEYPFMWNNENNPTFMFKWFCYEQ